MERIIEEFMNDTLFLDSIKNKIKELSPSGELEIYYVPSIILFILETINDLHLPNDDLLIFYNKIIMAIFEQLDVIPDEEYITNSIVKLVMYSRNCNSSILNKLCFCKK